MRAVFDTGEIRLIWDHILSLAAPAREIEIPDTYSGIKNGNLSDWSHASIEILTTEGRQQLDTLNSTFERIRSRGQYVIAMTIASIAFAGAAAGSVVEHVALFVSWSLGLAILVWTLLCSCAVFASRAELGSVDTILLSGESVTSDEELFRLVATAYVSAVRRSANAVNVRFTLLRNTTWFFIIGVLIETATLATSYIVP